MRRKLTTDDVAPTIWGGMVLAAGVTSPAAVPRMLGLGAKALAFGSIDFTSLDEYDDDDVLISVTGVGKPFACMDKIEMERDSLRAAQLVIEASGKKPVGILQSHAGGIMHWVMASYLDIDVVDVGASSRAHPTIALGAMGCHGDPQALIHQAAYSSGRTAGGSPLKLNYYGHICTGEALLRKAAELNRGAIMASRGMYRVGFLRERGAVGALSYQQNIGEALLAAPEGQARIAAIMAAASGSVLFQGKVSDNDFMVEAGEYLPGRVTVQDGAKTLRLGVFKEFLYADLDGERVTTFPDLQVALCPQTGNPLAIGELQPGREVTIMVAPASALPLGAGVWDASSYPPLEALLGAELASYALRTRR